MRRAARAQRVARRAARRGAADARFPELAAQKERLDPPALLALTHASLGVRHHRLCCAAASARSPCTVSSASRTAATRRRTSDSCASLSCATTASFRVATASAHQRRSACHDARSALRVAARRATSSSAECALVARARRPSGISASGSAASRRVPVASPLSTGCMSCDGTFALLLPPLSRPARRRRSPLHRVPSPLPRPQPHGKRRRAGSVGRARALAREPPRPRASAQVRHGRQQARRRECAIRRRGVPTPQLQRATAPTRPPGPLCRGSSGVAASRAAPCADTVAAKPRSCCSCARCSAAQRVHSRSALRATCKRRRPWARGSSPRARLIPRCSRRLARRDSSSSSSAISTRCSSCAARSSSYCRCREPVAASDDVLAERHSALECAHCRAERGVPSCRRRWPRASVAALGLQR